MERKDQYVAKLHRTIDTWSAKLDRAEVKVKGLQSDAKRQYEHALTNFNTRLNELKSRARKLEQAGEDTWDAIKKSIEVGIEEFKREWQSAREEKKLEHLEALPAAGESQAPQKKPKTQV